ncbi:zincin [Thozetella sp. PMI_491]|nr:zincin [Thozetella sp. PMI_491]
MASTTNLCLEPACLEATAQILWNLAPDYKQYDPCTQFEEMVCYGYRQKNDKETVGLTLPQNYNHRIEQIILESTYEYAANFTSSIKRDEDISAVDRGNYQKLRQSYDACMDTSAISKAGITPLLDFMEEIGELFPVDDYTSLLKETDYAGLQAAVVYLESYGVSTFETLNIGVNVQNSSETILSLNAPTTSAKNGSIYFDPSAIKLYQAEMLELFEALANQSKSSTITDKDRQTLVKSIVDFEVAVANATTLTDVIQDEIKTDGFGTRVALSDLDKLAPAIGYTKILTQMIPKGVEVADVVVENPTLLKHIGEIVTKTPKATLQSWLAFRSIKYLKDYVSSSILASSQSAPVSSDRSIVCINHVDTTLPLIMGRFYVTSSFTSNKRNIASKMLTDIRTQFIKRIESLDWMSDEVKKRAIAKVNNIQQNIGYPSSPGSEVELLDPNDISALYEGQNVTESYFGNWLTYQKWLINFQASKLGKPVDRGAFEMALDVVNAYYVPRGNNIFILAGIMQGAVFDPALPWYANYGALGAILGHEMTHGFDNGGRLYDETGSYNTWWDNKTVTEFQTRADCFVEQYDKFTYEGTEGPVNVDGAKTLGENLADAGGLHTAYDSWITNRAALELSLPSLEMFTHEQLFYVFHANMWCSSITPATAQASFPLDVHAAAAVRIQGMTQNSRGFREAFNCPTKEPVCELW